MRILADENVPRAIVAWLRESGQDVSYAAETRRQTPDMDLLAEAEAQARVVLTEDKDFGELVFRDRKNSHGVILLRMEHHPASARLVRLAQVWTVLEQKVQGHFAVVTPTRIRLRPLSEP